MKVLIISHLFPNEQNPVLGTFVAEQVRALSRICEVSVVCPVPWAPPIRGFPKYYAYSQIPSHSLLDDRPVYFPRYFVLPKMYTMANWTFPLATKRLFARIQEEGPFDIIHAHTLFPDGYSAARLAKRYGVPLVLTAHGYDVYDLPWRNNVFKRASSEAVKNADRLVAVSKWHLPNLMKLGAAESKIKVIPNGADQTLFFPRDAGACRRALNLPERPRRIILSVANLVEVKGLENLLTAFSIVKRSIPESALYIVGHGHLLSRLERLLKSLEISDSAVLVGAQPHKRMPLWFNAADLIALPSLAEGLPTALIEAISCGKPIVASRVGGIPELVSNSNIGLLADPGNVDKLAEALIEALNRSWDAPTILKHATPYSWASIAGQLMALYKELLEGPTNEPDEQEHRMEASPCAE